MKNEGIFQSTRLKIDNTIYYIFREDMLIKVKAPLGGELVELNSFDANTKLWNKPLKKIPDEIRIKVETIID